MLVMLAYYVIFVNLVMSSYFTIYSANSCDIILFLVYY